MDNTLVLILAAVALAEAVALAITLRRLRRNEEGGTFTPGKDCLLITFYYLNPDEITGNKDTDLQNAEKVTMQYPIEEVEKLLSAGDTYDEVMRKIRSSSPPPARSTLVATDVTLLRDCNQKRN